jgi:mannobiose 2-epimerase
MINKNQEVLKWAVELFELIEKYSRDKVHGGYIEAYDEDWSEINDVRLSEKDANEKKTMNTHLHLLEAYTNLIRVWPNEELIGAQKELIYLFLNIFINKDDHLKLFFNELWETKSSTISFGHDIEASWLLTEAAEIVGGKEIINACKQAAVKITDAVISVGTDSDGSIFNEREGANGCFDYDKHWWQQAEGMVGFMNSYQISGDDKYLESILHIWKFIKDKIIDYKNGEWYWKVNRTGERFPEDEKAGFWKCPYHNSRACIEMINRIKSQES